MDKLSTMIDCENCCSWTIASYEFERLHDTGRENRVSELPLVLLRGVSENEEIVVAYDDRIIWSRYFGCHSSNLPSDFKTFSVPNSFNHILWANFEFEKPSDQSLIVIKEGLLWCYSFSGERLQCKLSVEPKSVWSTRNNGLIVESQDVSNGRAGASLCTLYNLTHPCDELAPVICCTKCSDSTSVGHLSEFTAATRSSVVASLTSLNVLVTHDAKRGHSFWLVRKATENEKDAFYQQREANFAKMKPGDALKTPRFDKMPNFSPIPRASMLSHHRLKVDSPLSDVQSPMFMQSMRLTATKKLVPHSSPFAKGSFDLRSLDKSRGPSVLGMPWLEMPLTPNLCLQFIASDDQILKKHMPRFAASKVFKSQDLMGRSFICLQIKQMETLFLYYLRKHSNGNQITAIEKAGFIQCEDSINVEGMPYLAILEKDSSLTLFSGLHKMCKVRRWPNSPHLSLSSPHPSQTSLEETIKDFKVSIGNKIITNTFGGSKLLSITLPSLSENPVVKMFLEALKMYLQQEKYILFACEWFAVRNAVGKEVDKKIELRLFLQFLSRQIGMIFDQENQDEVPGEQPTPLSSEYEVMEDSTDSKTKKVRKTDSGSAKDFHSMISSSSARETLIHIGEVEFQIDEFAAECETSSPTKTAFKSDAPLSSDFELILKLSHLIYEESKLDIIKQPSSLLLAQFLARIAHALGMDVLKMQYLVDYPILSSCNIDFSQDGEQKLASTKSMKSFNCFPDVLSESDRLAVLKFFPSLANVDLIGNCLSIYSAPCFVKWVAELIKQRNLHNSDYPLVKYSINADLITFGPHGDKSSKSAAGSLHGEKDSREAIGKTLNNASLLDDVSFSCSSFPCIWGVTERIIKTATVLFYILTKETAVASAISLGGCPSTLNAGQGNIATNREDCHIDRTATMLSNQNFSSTVATASTFAAADVGVEATNIGGIRATGTRERKGKDLSFTDLLFRSVNGLPRNAAENNDMNFSPLSLFREGKDIVSGLPPETANWILNMEKIFASKYQHGRISGAVKSEYSQHGGKSAYNTATSANNGQNHFQMGSDGCASTWSSQTAREERSNHLDEHCRENDFLGHILLLIVEIGMDCDFVDTLPFGVSLPILNVIYEGHLNPSFNWPVRVIKLVRRRDLLKRKDVIFGDKVDSSSHDNQEVAGEKDGPSLLQKLGTQKQYILMDQCHSSGYISSSVSTADSQAVPNNFRNANCPPQSSLSSTLPETSGLEFDEEILSVLFADDCRVQSVKRMLNSSQPVKMKAQPQQTDLQTKLARYAKRTMALSVGRGMFTLSSVAPTLTSTEPIPFLNFGARVLPKNIIVNLTSATVSANSRQWAHYHNGVAAGLRIDQNSRDVDTAWVIYNRPKSSAAMDSVCAHTGFLLGLALNGHLDNMSAYNLHSYLCRNHEMTNISLLLGLSASKQGSRDGMLTKTLTLHVNALLPSGGTELDVGCNVQITALLAVGFLFMGSSDRHMAEVMLSQINRPPGPEMENCVNRESYSLTAGLSLGMVLLARGHNMFGGMKTGLTFTTQLYSYIKGGANPHAFSQNNCYQIQEGENINLCMTSPGATLATGLIFFNTCSYSIADWFKPPETALTIDTVLPEHLMLHVIAKGLICWQEIVPYKEWVKSNLPAFLTPMLDKFQSPVSGFIEMTNFDVSSHQAFCNLIAGSCFVLGLRFAGMQNKSAFTLILKYVKVFLHLLDLEQSRQNTASSQQPPLLEGSNAGFKTILNCLHCCLTAVCMVMAGSGNLQILSVIRSLHCEVANDFGYGHHMAVHMALGLLFLGRCQYTLRNDAASVAALLAAFYPVYPLTSVDNKYHLQAFRHLYVKAAEPRLLLTRNIKTKHVERVPVTIGLKASLNYDNYIYQTQTPCLVPQLDLVSTIEILSSSAFLQDSAPNCLYSESGPANSVATPADYNTIKNVGKNFDNQFAAPQNSRRTLSNRIKFGSFLPLRIDFDQKVKIKQFSLLLKSCLFVQPSTSKIEHPLRILADGKSNIHSTIFTPAFTQSAGANEGELSFACGLIDAFQFTATQFTDRLEQCSCPETPSISLNKRRRQMLMKALPVNSNLFLQQLNLVNCFVKNSDRCLILPANTPWLKYVHAKVLSQLMSSADLSKHSLLCLLDNHISNLLSYCAYQRGQQLHCLTLFICFAGLEVFLQNNHSIPAECGTTVSQIEESPNEAMLADPFWTKHFSSKLPENTTDQSASQVTLHPTCPCGNNVVNLKGLKPDLLESSDYFAFHLHKL